MLATPITSAKEFTQLLHCNAVGVGPLDLRA